MKEANRKAMFANRKYFIRHGSSESDLFQKQDNGDLKYLKTAWYADKDYTDFNKDKLDEGWYHPDSYNKLSSILSRKFNSAEEID